TGTFRITGNYFAKEQLSQVLANTELNQAAELSPMHAIRDKGVSESGTANCTNRILIITPL
ncbi:MAG: hypothetical protein WBH19_07665, partial [Candidatus Nanopelagicales bacterium]